MDERGERREVGARPSTDPFRLTPSKPVRTYKVAGIYVDLVEQGKIIRKEEEGIRILVDLDKRDRADAIQAIEDVLSQLKG